MSKRFQLRDEVVAKRLRLLAAARDETENDLITRIVNEYCIEHWNEVREGTAEVEPPPKGTQPKPAR